ncbi:hypothetical protein MML48_4g00021332 [Holotrichia oblita]|uniref:Uncharacterized protein n=1 Tax=Holotrichia oblita TaxID=644536 RepID=A0ACB9TA08_HOLOL|nr:hypothetical protein MML48_4g00021332 [Holotrichia oblita]
MYRNKLVDYAYQKMKASSDYLIVGRHQFRLQITLHVLSEERYLAEGAVAPPPWADPKVNPCATQPRGWQLLYWPPDGKCYKIFKMGYPCPDDMELSPAATKAGVREFSAECRCPPKSAQSTYDGRCHELFKAGPCQRGQYFAPDSRSHTDSESKKQHRGICRDIPKCENPNEIFWPQNGRCYERLTKGPCTKGQLITASLDGLAVCACNHKTDMIDYFYNGYGCFQHFTKGPCKEKGHLFLADRSCDCSDELPHFHDITKQCFEIGNTNTY